MDFHAETMLDMRHLQQAAQTLARLPSDGFTKPAGMRSPCPEMIRGNYIVIAGTRCNSQCRPTPQQIDEMDLVLDCLTDLPAPARRLLWARACRVRWHRLELMTGRSR